MFKNACCCQSASFTTKKQKKPSFSLPLSRRSDKTILHWVNALRWPREIPHGHGFHCQHLTADHKGFSLHKTSLFHLPTSLALSESKAAGMCESRTTSRAWLSRITWQRAEWIGSRCASLKAPSLGLQMLVSLLWSSFIFFFPLVSVSALINVHFYYGFSFYI